MKIIFLLTAGFICLALGAVGLLLPVWPTTPFVIAAAACFSCAPTLREKLMTLPFFGEHIRNYQSHTGLSKKTLAVSLTFLWGMLLLSCALISAVWVRVLLLFIGFAVTAHLLYMARPRRM